MQPEYYEGFDEAKDGVTLAKVAQHKTQWSRYDIACVWVKTLKKVWTADFIAQSLRHTGILPFTRSTHFERNFADIEIGDCIVKSEELQQQAEQRKLRDQHRAAQAETSVTNTITPVMPLRQTHISNIARVHGDGDDENLDCIAKTHHLLDWPSSESERMKPDVWKECLSRSPQLIRRLRDVDSTELLKWFDVGAALVDHDTISAEQVGMHICRVGYIPCAVGCSLFRSLTCMYYAGVCDGILDVRWTGSPLPSNANGTNATSTIRDITQLGSN